MNISEIKQKQAVSAQPGQASFSWTKVKEGEDFDFECTLKSYLEEEKHSEEEKTLLIHEDLGVELFKHTLFEEVQW